MTTSALEPTDDKETLDQDKKELVQQRNIECESTDLEEPVNEIVHLPPDLDPVIVNRYFKVLFAAILFMSIDLGILPACTVKMKKEFGIDNG